MLLPHLSGRDDVQLVEVVTTSPLSAVNAQRRFGFSRCSTDPSAILDDESIDVVFIVTRHSSHAELTCRALERGKTVFVEKPLALSAEQLDRVLDVVRTSGNDRLMVGFNRRFAPLLVDLRSRFDGRGTPAQLHYLVNAGPLAGTSWYRNSELEGSRFTGEGGHFIDTAGWWLDACPVTVHAVGSAEPDDLVVTVRFDDGSVATIAYSTTGHPGFPKEILQVVSGGRVARFENFRSATVWSGRRPQVRRSRWSIDKGQRHQLERFLAAVRSGAPMPIGLESLVATTRVTLAAVRSQGTGCPEPV
jgi:predicted dehydrogenase